MVNGVVVFVFSNEWERAFLVAWDDSDRFHPQTPVSCSPTRIAVQCTELRGRTRLDENGSLCSLRQLGCSNRATDCCLCWLYLCNHWLLTVTQGLEMRLHLEDLGSEKWKKVCLGISAPQGRAVLEPPSPSQRRHMELRVRRQA